MFVFRSRCGQRAYGTLRAPVGCWSLHGRFRPKASASRAEDETIFSQAG